MNNDNYKRAFSNIRPSDERLERIFDMTEKRKRARGLKTGLIVAIAVLSTLMCGALTANAATGGALFEGVKLVINGEEANLSEYLKTHKSYKNDDGETVEEYEFALPENDGSISFEMVEDTLGAAAGSTKGDSSVSIEVETEDTTTNSKQTESNN